MIRLFSYLIIQLLIFSPVYGQEVLSKEQEKEIKLSDKYYYGEGTDLNETVAWQLAMEDLERQLVEFSDYSANKEEILLSVKTKAKTAQLQMTDRIKMIAWIEITDIHSQVPLEKQTIETKPEKEKPAVEKKLRSEIVNPEQISGEIKDNTSDTVVDKTPDNVKTEVSNNIKVETQNTQYMEIVQELSTSKTFPLFYRKVEALKRQGKLVFGSKKTSFSNHMKCLIVVFSTSGTLVAMLDEGNDSRPDLLTGKTIQNPEQYYKGNELFWIQINK